MKLLITGMSGTVAPKLAARARAEGAEILAWDRRAADPGDPAACARCLDGLAPDAIAHLAFGPESWAGFLSGAAAARGIPFLFTSTVMVFGDEPDGPHLPADARSTKDEYGLYKARCEDAVLEANATAIVARLGWQIHPDGLGNNMLGELDKWQAEGGKVGASRLWIPACSFMEDTANALWRLLSTGKGGIYHVDGNAEDAWSFDRIVLGLKAKFGREAWKVEPNDSYRHDQRLGGNPGLCAPISARLFTQSPA